MRYYFLLQYRMLNRRMTEAGLHPAFGYLIAVVAFIGLSDYFFFKIHAAIYIYPLLCLFYVLSHSEVARNDFLRSSFSIADYFKVRLVENTVIMLPFGVFLAYKGHWLVTAGLLVSGTLLAFTPFRFRQLFTLRTPFYRYPFEFAVGFRKTYPVIMFAYFIAYMSVAVDNFDLGIFALLVLGLICLTYYGSPERKFYVWIFSFGPRRFLFHKVWAALLFSTMLSLPVLLGLGLYFSDHILVLLLVQGLSYLYLLTFLLAKYSAFPEPVSVPQGILIAFGFVLPPLLLGIIPMFYIRSIKKLKVILG